jgi:hypothetical protein
LTGEAYVPPDPDEVERLVVKWEEERVKELLDEKYPVGTDEVMERVSKEFKGERVDPIGLDEFRPDAEVEAARFGGQ